MYSFLIVVRRSSGKYVIVFIALILNLIDLTYFDRLFNLSRFSLKSNFDHKRELETLQYVDPIVSVAVICPLHPNYQTIVGYRLF